MAILIVFSGRSGTGKSSIARELARKTGSFWLRVDVIIQALRHSGVECAWKASYNVAYALAKESLLLGSNVIGDSVNYYCWTRDEWRDAGEQAGAQVIEVETICSDLQMHQQRYENRNSDVPELNHPKWEDIIKLEYQPWGRDHLKIDTARCSIEEGTNFLLVKVPNLRIA